MTAGARLGLVTAIVSLLVSAASGAGATEPSPTAAAAVAKAKTHVVSRFGIVGLYSVRVRRSARDPSWAAVTGYFRRPRVRPNWWAVYLRTRATTWKVVWSGRGFAATEPAVRAPCDTWPPLSEPSC